MSMQFEYDEEGGAFFYFLFSFWGLVLLPATYYLWPRQTSKDEKERLKRECYCVGCHEKRHRLKNTKKWSKNKENAVKVGLLIGWVIFAILAYKVSQVELDFTEYDPFVELGIDRGANKKEIKTAYKKLSLQFHPDKPTGDAKKFMKISKAYSALTDEEARKNWEEFGNPDGPGVTKFGIALPKWIIEDENSMWVLLVYGLIFMVIMPIVVGVWWYRSIKFSKDQVLLDTTRLYFYFFQKVTNMALKKVIMVLAASFEFDKMHNSEIVERPSDNELLPQVMKQIPDLDEKKKEKPLCYAYSIKARTLLHTHFMRMELPQDSLGFDQSYIVSKCPVLINEMVNIISQLVATAVARQSLNYMPRLSTVENCMKVSQMIIQGLDSKASPLQQLPHIKGDMLRHFVTKKRNIQRIRDLVALSNDERRLLLRTLTDDEYQDVVNVSAMLPNVTVSIRSEVLDDGDSTITAGSIVTVTVKLTRTAMGDLFEHELSQAEYTPEGTEEQLEKKEEEEGDEENKPSENAQAAAHETKTKVWDKKKGKKKTGKAKAKKPKAVYQWKKPVQTVGSKTETEVQQDDTVAIQGDEQDNTDSDKEETENQPEGREVNPTEKKVKRRTKKVAATSSASADKPEEEEDDWDKYQEESKKENSLERKKKESHPVHCPYYPDGKQEGWYLYVADKRSSMLISAPVQILSLKTEEEIQLKFSAPSRVGFYTYSVILRSDSYLDFDQVHNIKLDVKEAKIIEDHPQWDISEDEDDKDKEFDEQSDDSDYSTEDDDYE